MNIVNIAKAVGKPIVSCSGSDCSLCSLLQTVSNGYNFFLGVCVAVAVLVLIIAGVSYLLSSGDKFKLQKSSYWLKSGIGGFALILVGWLVIQSAIRVIGFTNAGNWWSFECNDGSQVVATGDNASNGSEYYNNLKTFPDLLSYFGSNEKTAKITGPIDAKSFASQLKALKDGEVLHFLAPVQLDSSGATEELFLPLLTVLKEGDSLNMQSTGEYWNLIQNEWPQLKDQINDPAVSELLSKYLGNDSYTSDQSLVDANGNAISTTDNQDLTALYGSLAGLLQESATGGDRTGTSLNDSLAGNESLSELLAILASSEGNSQEQTDRIMSLLTTETMKLADILMVDKESSNEILTTDQTRCTGSGGEWSTDNTCQCPSGYQLQADGYCQSEKDLAENCGNTGGNWIKVSEGFSPSALCGESTGSWGDLLYNVNSASERANISEVASERYYCECKDASCIDGTGNCRSDLKDDDGDGIANSADHCPATPATDKKMINKTKGGEFYGCSCYDIGTVPKECPPDQCVGNYWADYPSDKQECKNGALLTTSCQPLERSYDETCSEKNLADGSGTNEWNGNTNSWDSKTNNWNGNTNAWAQSPYNNSSASSANPATKSSGTSGKSTNASKSGNNGKMKDDMGGWQRDSRNRVPDSNDWGQSYSGPEGVKQALKRIYERDKLRYLMIFKYTSQIYNRGGGSGYSAFGITGGCSHFCVTYGTGVRMMDRLIMHEATHSADFCVGAAGIPSMEYVAVGNELGSVGRIKEAQGQKEEIKVTNPPPKEGEDKLEARGYGCRLLNVDIDPKGDMNPTMLSSDADYAKQYKSDTGNPWVYGWLRGGEPYTLKLTDNEHNKIQRILETMDQRKCYSRPPEDLPQLNEENGYKEQQLKGCKEAPVIKLGNPCPYPY